MAKYVYPAVFTKEDTGYSIHFPDLDGCYTQGDNIIDGLEMAEDVLALTLYGYEKNDKEIPEPSDIASFGPDTDKFVVLVLCDTEKHRKANYGKAVKKTLTIPAWLNEDAIDANINFSQVLQEALIEKLSKINTDEKTQ